MNGLLSFKEHKYLARRLRIPFPIKKSKYTLPLSFVIYFFSKRKTELLRELKYFAGPVTSALPIRVEDKLDINPENFWGQIKELLLPSSVVLDLGCGIKPVSFVDNDLLICLEPFEPYISYLRKRYRGARIIIIQQDALTFLRNQPNDSIDTILAIDVLEHLSKDDGYELLRQMVRVCRIQSLIVTPNGFMPQHVSELGTDEWGYEGNIKQSHLSGWTPSDFKDWTTLVSPGYGYESEFEYGSGVLGAFFRKELQESKDIRKIVVIGSEVLTDKFVWDSYIANFIQENLKWKDDEILFILNTEFSQGSTSLFREDLIPDNYQSVTATFIEDFSKPSSSKMFIGHKILPSAGDLISYYCPKELEFVYKVQNREYFQLLTSQFETVTRIRAVEI